MRGIKCLLICLYEYYYICFPVQIEDKQQKILPREKTENALVDILLPFVFFSMPVTLGYVELVCE